MKNAVYRIALAVLLLTGLCGCWDQQLLKDERNVSIAGMDNGPEKTLKTTVSIRDITVTESGSKDTSETHTVVARSSKHAQELLDEQVSGKYSNAKMRVLLLGEEMVRNRDVMPYLDVYYRDPRSPLNARVAVAQGKAEDVIRLKKTGTKTIGLQIDDLLRTMEEAALIPKVTIQTLHPLDRGYDFALPYLTIREGMPTMDGIALFDGVRMRGKLDADRSKVYMLLTDSHKKNMRLTMKTQGDKRDNGYDYVTIEVKKARRSLKIAVANDGRIRVNLWLKLRITVIEDPSNHLYKREVMQNLERTLTNHMNEEAAAVIGKMQRSRHDGLGIARRLMSFHPATWKQLDWKEEYPRIPIESQVTLRIINTGIIR
ncbi:Ger(x)C family spore germination protein [Cohnella cellulosilytica]|uniref:Ger(X)C family spore germination protein n=1 Tax=Cohnella cellulosilytica TaxID=986710 RepID=A0ABW2FDI8_9BACL